MKLGKRSIIITARQMTKYSKHVKDEFNGEEWGKE
jgi:hypothetical protein